jgi:hypothetical protein
VLREKIEKQRLAENDPEAIKRGYHLEKYAKIDTAKFDYD